MSARAGQWSDDDIEDLIDDGNSDGSDLVKTLRQALRQKSREAKEYKTQVDGFQTQTRKQIIESTLTARNLNPKIAAFIPSDVKDEAGIENWITEYGDVFGPPAPPAPPAGQNQSALTDDQISALRGMDVVGTQTQSNMGDVLGKIQSAQSAEEIIALIESQGGGAGR